MSGKKTKEARRERQKFYTELFAQYQKAQQEGELRKQHKESGWDEMDKLYRSNINAAKWPFSSRIFMPVAFSSLIKKDTRLIATKMTGRLVPTEDGQELGAMVGTELLHAQWDDVDHHESEPMLMKIFRWSQQARRYGGAYVWAGWKKERGFDGPTMQVYERKHVLTLSGSTNVQEGVFLIDFPMISEFFDVNDTAQSGPIYNPDTLAKIEAMGQTTDDTSNSVARELKGLGTRLDDANTGTTGRMRRVTRVKYRSQRRWIDFVPNAGDEEGSTPMFILRDIKNPYDHGQVSLVPLNYYPIDDDVDGVSELEPVRSLMKALNALVCNFMDSANIELFPILKGHPTNVNWSTIDYHARAQWLMQNPATDLVKLEHSNSGLQKFTEIYKMLVGAINEALGESTGEGSTANPFAGDKTATEIKDTALLRSARDNFNKLALSTALQKVMYYWWEMDKQFLTNDKVIRVVGKEAIEYFTREGLHDYELSEEGYELIQTYMEENPGVEFDLAYEALREQGALEEYAVPLFGVDREDGTGPKLQLDRSGKTGFLTVSNDDLSGKFRYVPDIESMSLPNDTEQAQAMMGLMDKIIAVKEDLMQTGDTPKFKDLLVDIAAKMRMSNAEQYFGAGDGMGETSLTPEQQAAEQGMDPMAAAGGAPMPGQPMTMANLPVPPVGQPAEQMVQ